MEVSRDHHSTPGSAIADAASITAPEAFNAAVVSFLSGDAA